jgi:pimeloyl-ACP methyl ester carboxylesterase
MSSNIIKEKQYQIKFDGVNVTYFKVGKPENSLLIFLSGWPAGEFTLGSGILEELAKHFYVISFMYPGNYDSEPLPLYNNIFLQYANILRSVIVHEGLTETSSVLVAQSFGGGVASAYLSKYKKNISSIVFVNSFLNVPIKKSDCNWWMSYGVRYGAYMSKSIKYLPKSLVRLIIRKYFGISFNKEISHGELNDFFKKREAMIHSLASLFRKVMGGQTDIWPSVDLSEIPILFVWGNMDGIKLEFNGGMKVRYVERVSKEIKKQNPRTKLVTVDGGHMVLYEQPERMANLIIKNLNELVDS